ncbi:MAG: shikimate dehydrogenase [Gemmatimonadetes bacterium]|nr:shikimate dehydrogenase [Gemmatimonadota bacterium]
MELPGRLVILGHPVAHALSPAFQNAALHAAGIPIEYEAVDVRPEELTTLTNLLREAHAAGNVTVPHKEAFARLCTRLTPVADRAGAVNTFWTEEDGALVGDNTDVGGFDAAARAAFGPPKPKSVVALLGAGGAAAGVLAAIERWNDATVRIAARSAPRAQALADRYPRFVTIAPDVESAVRGADLVVNASPVGLHGDDLPVDPALLGPHADVFDLTYRRSETPWVLACRARGLRAADGLAMVVEQGALAFERWFGQRPDRKAMWSAVRR